MTLITTKNYPYTNNIFLKKGLFFIVIYLFSTTTILAQSSKEVKIDSLLRNIDMVDNDSIKAKNYIYLSRLTSYSDPKTSKEYAQLAINYSEKAQYWYALFEAYSKKFNAIYNLNPDTDSLLKYILLEEKCLEEKGTWENIGDSWFDLYFKYGQYYSMIRKTDKQLAAYLKALEITQEYNISAYQKAMLLNNIGAVYYTRGEKHQALEAFQIALKIIPNDRNKGYPNLNCGIIYREISSKVDSAQMYFNEALRIFELEQDVVGISAILCEQGAIYDMQKKYKLAYATYQKAQKIIEENNLEAELKSLYKFLANHFYLQEKYNDAIDYAEKSLQLSMEQGIIVDIGSTYEVLYDSYAKVGNYKRAFEVQGASYAWKDSLDNVELLSKVETLKTEFEVEQKEAENELLKSQQAFSAIAIQRRNILTVSLLLIAILISIITITLRRTNRKKQQQNEILEQEVQKRTEELLTSNRELEEIKQKQVLEEAKSRFFANVSHEFRTPLTLIQAPIEKVLKNRRVDTKDANLLQKALRNSKNLMHLVTDILDLGKLETEKVALNETSQVLYLVVRRVIANFETYAQSKSISLKLEYHPNTDLQVEIDKEKFEKILYNYISNAIKFTPKGGNITVSVNDLKNKLQIAVADTGKGIPVNELEAVFERYYQVKSPEDNAPLGQVNHYAGGTGIGLALCKEYAELFDGKVWAESPNDKNGATFYFEFLKKEFFAPLATQDAISISQSKNGSITPMAAIATAEKITQQVAHHAAQSTILIVEDNYDLRQFLKELLEEKYNVITAENGQEALKLLSINTSNRPPSTVCRL